MLLKLTFSLCSVIVTAFAQVGSNFTDPDNGILFWGYKEPAHGVTYGYVFPPLESNPTEFIGEIVAPIATKWAGVSPGGAMINNLLLVAWPNGNSIVRSARFATNYLQPIAMPGPILTDLPATKVNSTHWKWVFRCQNCVSWATSTGVTAALPIDGFGASSWVWSNEVVDTPSDPQSTFWEHNDFGFFGLDFSQAHVDANIYAKWVNGGTSRTPATSGGPGGPGTGETWGTNLSN